MPDFNNLLEAEAWYAEEAQAKAEHREPDHSPKPEPEPPHPNTVFDPDPALAYEPIPEPETITQSASPYVTSDIEVEPTYDPAVLTPIPQYNSDGTDATVEPPVAEVEFIEPKAKDEKKAKDSDTPKE